MKKWRQRELEKSQLYSYLASNLLDGDCEALNWNIPRFLTEIREHELDVCPERYWGAHEEYRVLLTTDTDKLFAIVEDADFFGLLGGGKDEVKKRLAMLFPTDK